MRLHATCKEQRFLAKLAAVRHTNYMSLSRAQFELTAIVSTESNESSRSYCYCSRALLSMLLHIHDVCCSTHFLCTLFPFEAESRLLEAAKRELRSESSGSQLGFGLPLTSSYLASDTSSHNVGGEPLLWSWCILHCCGFVGTCGAHSLWE
jgi:hypothetical protein